MISDLPTLLRSLAPLRQPGRYVYTTLPDAADVDGSLLVATVREPEGLSAIMAADDALRLGLTGTFPCSWITLTVHSDLAAVGLTAAVATALSEAGISCNMVAGLRHDHLFVPEADAERAMAVLRGLQGRASAQLT